MKRFVAFCLITTLLALSGCVNKNDDNVSVIGGADGPTSIYLNASDDTGNNFTQIDQKTAKLMMELDDGHVIVDVRREDEFAEGHIRVTGLGTDYTCLLQKWTKEQGGFSKAC